MLNIKTALAGLLGVCGLAAAADAQVTVRRGGVTVGNPGYYGGGPGVNFGRGGVTYSPGYNSGFYNYGAPYSYSQYSPRYGWNSGNQFTRPIYGAGVYNSSSGYYSRPGVVYSQPGVVYSQPGVVYSQPGVTSSTAPMAMPSPNGVQTVGGTTTTSDGTVVQAGGTPSGTTVYQPNVVPAGGVMVVDGHSAPMAADGCGCCGDWSGGYVTTSAVVYDDGHGKRKRGLFRRR